MSTLAHAATHLGAHAIKDPRVQATALAAGKAAVTALAPVAAAAAPLVIGAAAGYAIFHGCRKLFG